MPLSFMQTLKVPPHFIDRLRYNFLELTHVHFSCAPEPTGRFVFLRAAKLLAAALLAAGLKGLRRFTASLFAASLPRVVVSRAGIAKMRARTRRCYSLVVYFFLFILVPPCV